MNTATDTPARNTKVMNRFELTSRLVAKLKHEEAVIGGIGNTNFDLWAAGHRPQNFYMLGSMGSRVRSRLAWRWRSRQDRRQARSDPDARKPALIRNRFMKGLGSSRDGALDA